MPDLEKQIAQWKASLKTVLGDSDEIVDELESHLREEIDRLIRAGDAAETAFLTAQAKLGQPADIAAEYARAAAPAFWFPVSFGIPLFIILFAFFNWSGIVQLIVSRNVYSGLIVATIGSGVAIIFYTAFVGCYYVINRLIHPMSLGQLKSLRRSLMVGNAAISLFCLIILLYIQRQAWPPWVTVQGKGLNWSNFVQPLIPMFWSAALAVLLWINPKKLHRWALLSIVTLTVTNWGNLILQLILDPWPPNGFRRFQHVAFWVYTIVPLCFVLLGRLPARRADRRIAE
ncbi:MAG TPA: permease prefix domain 1-containing protein [Pirellulales bacterium]|nr:permease prefix domain 1-containing protein [Pirellulales bacterium]